MILDANVVGVHAHQILLARRTGKGDPRCFSAPPSVDDKTLTDLVAHLDALAAEPPDSVRAWVDGAPSKFDPKKDLEALARSRDVLTLPPELPFRVVEADLLDANTHISERASDPRSRSRARALASLYQTVLEIERDGDLLQSQLRLYAALDLLTTPGAYGVKREDDGLLAFGRKFAAKACTAPYDVTPPAWQIASRKLWSWEEKLLHVRDGDTLATELLKEPDVQKLVPRLEGLAPKHIVVLGHSYTMAEHWASPSSFTDIAQRVLLRMNPRIRITHVNAGGLTASRALKEKLPRVLEERPNAVLIVVELRKEEDFEALRALGKMLKEANVRAEMFDDVEAPRMSVPGSGREAAVAKQEVARVRVIAREVGVRLLDVGEALLHAPGHDQFVSLDGDHMTEPYHRFMAKKWLAHLAEE